ncbi:protein of unknown function [Streptomyces sp. KY75]|nr:protein of unknown function [Streptomyces sp. KY70]CAD5992808.1 protein of unknown function [Streptomyces sp. KY75]
MVVTGRGARLSEPSGAGQGLLRGTGGDGARNKPVDEVCQPLPVARCWHTVVWDAVVLGSVRRIM